MGELHGKHHCLLLFDFDISLLFSRLFFDWFFARPLPTSIGMIGLRSKDTWSDLGIGAVPVGRLIESAAFETIRLEDCERAVEWRWPWLIIWLWFLLGLEGSDGELLCLAEGSVHPHALIKLEKLKPISFFFFIKHIPLHKIILSLTFRASPSPASRAFTASSWPDLLFTGFDLKANVDKLH